MGSLSSKSREWFSLSSAERRLLLWTLFYTVKNAVIVFGFPSNKANWILSPLPVRPAAEEMPADLCKEAVERISNNLRPSPNCLVKALTLRDLFARHGHISQIRLLARKNESGIFDFHAVVTIDGLPVFGDAGEWKGVTHMRGSNEVSG